MASAIPSENKDVKISKVSEWQVQVQVKLGRSELQGVVKCADGKCKCKV
jgi:hypothetical protein